MHRQDIKTLAGGELSNLDSAFGEYNEEQYTTVKLPGSSEAVCCVQILRGGIRLRDA